MSGKMKYLTVLCLLLLVSCSSTIEDTSNETKVKGQMFYTKFDGYIYVANHGGVYGDSSGITMFLTPEGKPYNATEFCINYPDKRICHER